MLPIHQMFDLSGATVIVTGGAGLLGREFCLAVAEAGGHAIVADGRIDAALEVERTITDRGLPAACAVETDVSNPGSVAAMVECVLARHGRIDGLVNSAALDPKFETDSDAPANAFEEYPLEAWNRGLQVNLTGCFLATQAVGRVMVRQGAGSIVNICSTYGLVGPDQRIYQRDDNTLPRFYKPVVYSVSKSALLGLTRYLAAYWAGKNIRINTLTPGGVRTNNDESFVRSYSYRTPLGRMACKSEYSAAVVFLLSQASSYMTGANLVIDGGWTAW